MTYGTVFQRHEKKYLLSREQYQALAAGMQPHMQQDDYGLHTICTLYYDTADNRSIRQREDRTDYREKLRLRSYGVPAAGDTVFVELKKKLGGVTHKRRLPLPFAEAKAWLQHGQLPSNRGQVFGEVEWFLAQNAPGPKAIICYDRIALFGREDAELRLTFDFGIRFRREALDLSRGDWGSRLLAGGEVMMEVKTPGAIPLWLSRELSAAQAYPVSFSKYCSVFESLIREEERRHAG